MRLYFIEEDIKEMSNEELGEIIRRMNQYLNGEELTPISKKGEFTWRQLTTLHGKQLRDNRRNNRKRKAGK